jgi:hypothetical protein
MYTDKWRNVDESQVNNNKLTTENTIKKSSEGVRRSSWTFLLYGSLIVSLVALSLVSAGWWKSPLQVKSNIVMKDPRSFDDTDNVTHARMNRTTSPYPTLMSTHDAIQIRLSPTAEKGWIDERDELEGATGMDSARDNTENRWSYNKDDARIIDYACPSITSDNYQQPEWYQPDHQLLLSNMSQYLDLFRHLEFDNWGRSYTEVLEGMKEWKLSVYSSSLLRRDAESWHIYESASGIGLNLFMTLEILLQQKQPTKNKASSKSLAFPKHIYVYGNDYMPTSVQTAQQLWQRLPLKLKMGNGVSSSPVSVHMGRFCTSYSTHLQYIPSSSMDAVFCGYITPLADPLETRLTSQRELDYYYTALCEDKNNTKPAKQAQRVQEEWYAAWVTELIRLAKPGAWISIEQVSYPFCAAYFDWGGVKPEFWLRAIRRYQWPVDVTSLDMQKDKLFTRRYHVAMRKLSQRRTN